MRNRDIRINVSVFMYVKPNELNLYGTQKTHATAVQFPS